jgi:hypothetical protein
VGYGCREAIDVPGVTKPYVVIEDFWIIGEIGLLSMILWKLTFRGCLERIYLTLTHPMRSYHSDLPSCETRRLKRSHIPEAAVLETWMLVVSNQRVLALD